MTKEQRRKWDKLLNDYSLSQPVKSSGNSKKKK